MSEPESEDAGVPATPVTGLLEAAAGGDVAAAHEVLALVYDNLRGIARARIKGERRDHTLQPTALVHEVYVRMVGGAPVAWENRAQFYFAASEAMRRILVDRARARARLKRGGDGRRPPDRVPLGDLNLAEEPDSDQILMLDDALGRLEREDQQAAAVVRLRFFAGLSVAATADALGVSPSTVDRDWAFARAKLHRFMRESGA